MSEDSPPLNAQRIEELSHSRGLVNEGRVSKGTLSQKKGRGSTVGARSFHSLPLNEDDALALRERHEDIRPIHPRNSRAGEDDDGIALAWPTVTYRVNREISYEWVPEQMVVPVPVMVNLPCERGDARVIVRPHDAAPAIVFAPWMKERKARPTRTATLWPRAEHSQQRGAQAGTRQRNCRRYRQYGTGQEGPVSTSGGSGTRPSRNSGLRAPALPQAR